MLSLFIKKKLKDTGNTNAAQEGAANHIVSVCIRLQQKWAGFMQRYTERLTRNGKLIILCLFCLTAGSLSLYLIASNVMNRKVSSFNVAHLKTSPFVGKSGDENTKSVVIISKTEYEKIKGFRLYMDSLARSPSGKKRYNSILSQRPGLMDSILLIENIYQLQNKK